MCQDVKERIITNITKSLSVIILIKTITTPTTIVIIITFSNDYIHINGIIYMASHPTNWMM